jgi:hypothetical protein
VEEIIASVQDAFDGWKRIKDRAIAQDYLFALLFKERV